MKIALDAMGGDHGPAPAIEGALQAAQECDVEVLLVGDESILTAECRRLGCTDSRVSIRHASQVVEMHESPATVARKKRDSSIWIATELVKSGEASAVVSPGNTGASMVASFFLLGLTKGVERPAIATSLPTLTGTAIMLDVGANVDCTAQHLAQFAIMGNEYGKYLFGKPNPRVGLLSIGEEDSKGNEVTKEAFKLLKASPLNFIGNIEGRDIYNGRCDVVVTDGFTGNVCLKVSESLAEMLTAMIREELSRDILSVAGAALSKRAFARLKRRVDYTEMGGAPLLGMNGAAIICHGASPVKAIKNAVRVAADWVRNDVNQHIKTALEAEAVLAEGREGGRE
jgi:glycerol-3-phosphate acyltransferase PlsX